LRIQGRLIPFRSDFLGDFKKSGCDREMEDEFLSSAKGNKKLLREA